MEFDSPMSKKLDELYRKVKLVEEALEHVKLSIQKLQAEEKKEIFKGVPGIEGIFDGVSMLLEDGSKRDVPANYAAKSKLVYGDKLKIVHVDGKELFKQVEKVERRELHAVLSRKEGGWYALTDAGSYKISDTAAEFQKAEVNDEGIVIIPVENPNVPYAALEELTKNANKPVATVSKNAKSNNISRTPVKDHNKEPAQHPVDKKVEKPEVISTVSVSSEPTVKTIRHLDDDDLV